MTRRDVIMERGSIWGEVIRPYVMPEERSVGIDTELQVKLVDALLREGPRRSSGGASSDSEGGPA